MKSPSYTILIPSLLLQYLSIVYRTNPDHKQYDSVSFVIFFIAIALFVVGLVLFIIPLVNGEKHFTESLRTSSFLDGLSLFFLYFSLMGNYLYMKYPNTTVVLSWINLVLGVIYLSLFTFSWIRNIVTYEISPTIVAPAILFLSYKFNLFEKSTAFPYDLFLNSSFYLQIAFYGHIIYRFVRAEPLLVDAISGLSGVIIINYSSSWFGVFLCIPLLYILINKLKSKELTMDQLIIGDAGLVVGFAGLMYPIFGCINKCNDARKVISYIAQALLWLFILFNIILMVANIIPTPLDNFLDSQNLPAKAVPPGSRISVIQPSTSNSAREMNDQPPMVE